MIDPLFAEILNELESDKKTEDEILAEIRRLKKLDVGFRKPVGISDTGSTTIDGVHFMPVLVAVCDDGTTWEWNTSFKEWRQFATIPGTRSEK